MDMILRTPRLILRRQTEADIPAIVAALNDFEVARWLPRVPFPYSEAEARAWVSGLEPPRPDAAHLAVELPGHGMVGVVGIERALGYWLDRRYHGRGLMTEASVGLLDWHFAAFPHRDVLSGALVGNAASLRVQEKLGFAPRPGTDMRLVRSLGREVAHVTTELTRPAYEAAKLKLRSGSWT